MASFRHPWRAGCGAAVLASAAALATLAHAETPGGWQAPRAEIAQGRTAAHDADGLAEKAWRRRGGTGMRVKTFLRAGASDGDTSPFRGGWQAGVLVEAPFVGRPDSAFSVGVEQGLLSDRHRANGADMGLDLGGADRSLEIAYSDRIGPRLTVQPDLQLIRRPGGVRDADNVVIAGVRFVLDLD